MTSPSDLRQSIRAYLALMLYLVAVKVVIGLIAAGSSSFRSPSQMAVFAWPALAIFTAVGMLGIFLGHRIGLPGVWSAGVPLRWRLSIPTVAGLLMGALAVGIDLLSGWTAMSAKAMGVPSINIAWPYSLLIYPGGAVIVDVIYYLVPISLLVWLATRIWRDSARFGLIYWIVGALAALIEPVTQTGGNGLATMPAIAAAFFTQDLVANLAQVWLFRRAGFGSAVVFRVAFYLVWHVAYGLTGA